MSLRDRLKPRSKEEQPTGSVTAGAVAEATATAGDFGRARPSADEINDELKVHKRRQQLLRVVASTIGGLLTVAAIVVLVATFIFPTLRIYGTSMTPTLVEGEIVVSYKAPGYETGDIVAFYYNNKILVKRVICKPGDWFDMQDDGTVYVNREKIDEPYVTDEGFGKCDIELPYQVPDEQYFVMGDQRESSIDSRMTQIGCVPREQIVGRVFLRVWPLGSAGLVS